MSEQGAVISTQTSAFIMRRFVITIAAATAFVAGAPIMGASVGAAPIVAPEAIRAATDSMNVVESVQFIWAGRDYCWYDDGWHGPGWYWCGYAFNSGYGWGGGYGWHGFRGGHRGGRVGVRGSRVGGAAVIRSGRVGGAAAVRGGGGRVGGAATVRGGGGRVGGGKSERK
jgi:hypothetical protein